MEIFNDLKSKNYNYFLKKLSLINILREFKINLKILNLKNMILKKF